MSLHATLLAYLFCLFVSNTALAQSNVLTNVQPESAGFSSSRLSRIDSNMNEWVRNKWTNGAVALIAHNGKIVYDKAFGYNDLDTKADRKSTRLNSSHV